MRNGYADNEKLAEYVEATPRLARPIIETLTIEASDLKDTKDEFDAARSAGGLSAEFTIFDEGGCRLAGTGADAILSSDRSIDTSADITSLVPPTESPLGVAVVELGGVNTTGREIWGAKAFLDPNTGSGKEVEFWHCNLYQFEGVDISGNEEAWNLRYLASDRVEATATSAGDVGFSFAKRATVPVVGNPPDVSDPRIGAGLSIKGATVVMVIYALKANGDIASNVSWRCNSGASSVTSGDHTIYRYDLTALDTPAEGSSLRYTANSVVGVPDMEFTANTSYSNATIIWDQTTTKLNLGQAPTSGTDLELTLQTATPSDTSVTAEIYNDANTTWYSFVDNDIIGEDRSSEGGSDLSAMTRQQSYDVKATLSTSTDTSHTPRLYRIGVQEVTSEVVDGLLDVTAASWAIDPITSQSEIPTMSLTLHRDGEKDYRSWSDELFSTNQLNELLFRVWVGHPDLAKRYWLHIDDFIVGNYTPTESGISVELLSPLQYALVEIPPKTGSSRAPVPYENATLKSVYADIVENQAAIQARYLGTPIEDATSSNNVTKTLAVEEQAVDVLRQLNYINGSATISSQGVLKVVPLFDGESPSPHANFPYDELTVLSTDTGFDRRITKFDVPYGWDGNKYTNEQVAKPPQDVLDRLGPIAMSQANQLDDGVARWLRTSGHADRIGSRMIENFLNGLSQIHFRSHTAKPWLEPGDAVAIESDVYVGIDPRNNRALRGRGWSRGIVTQCHDVMGHEFTVWVQSWYNVNASNTTFSWDAGMTPGGKVLYQPYDPVAEQTQALWRAEFGTQAITITAGAGLTGGGDLTANRTIAMSRYGFESLSDPDGGGDKLPFFDDSQDGFQWLTVGSGLSITDTTITATGTDFNAGTGLSESSNTFAIKYAAQASTPNAGVGNLIDGAADSGDIASADLILYQRDSDGVVRKDTVGALPFTNNAGTVTSVSGTGTVSGLTLSGTVTSSGNLTLGGTLSVGVANGGTGLSAGIAANQFLMGNGTANPYVASGANLVWSGTQLTINDATIAHTGSGGFTGDGSGLTSVSADTSTVTDLTTQTATYYPIMADGTSGAVSHFVDASELSYSSSTDTLNLVSAVLSGDLTVDTSTLVVDSTNNRVGLGTTSPSVMLELRESSNGVGDDVIRLRGHGNNSDNTVLGAVEWYNGDGSGDQPGVVCRIEGVSGNSNGHMGELVFKTHDGSESGGEGSNPVERMRIDNSGDVTITKGGSSTAKIDLTNATSGSRGYLQATDAGAVTLATEVAGGQIALRDNANSINLITADYNGTDTVRINSNGNNTFAINATGSATSATMRWRFGGTDEARIQWLDSSNQLRVRLEDSTDQVSVFIGGASGANDRRFDIQGIADHEGVVAVENAQLYVDEYGTQYEDTGTVTIDWNKGNQQLIDFDSTSTTTTININDTDMEAGGSYILLLQYNGGSSQTVAWTSSTALLWANGDEPTSTYTAGSAGDITVVQFFKTTVATDKIIGSYYIVT